MKIGYDYADWRIFWKLDSFFDLTSEQKEFLHPQIDQFLAWHKTKELPLYASLLKQVQEKAKDGLTVAELDWVYDQTVERVEQTVKHVVPNFSIFLASINNQQIERYKQNLSQQRTTSPNDKQEELSKQTIEQAEKWIGKLNNAQKTLIIKLRKSIPDISKERALHSENTRNAIINFIEQDHNASAIEQKLLELYIDYEKTYSKEYGRQVMTQRKAFKDMILGIDKILTPPQRTHFLTKIDLLIEDIENIKEGRDNRFFESLRRIVF